MKTGLFFSSASIAGPRQKGGGLLALTAAVGTLALAACQHIGMSPLPMYQEVGFDRAKPILEERCLSCHQGDMLGARLPDFTNSAELYDPDRKPRVIVPGDPENSRLMQVIYLEGESPGSMPPVGHALSLEEKDTLGQWIRQGAVWPDGEHLKSRAAREN